MVYFSFVSSFSRLALHLWDSFILLHVLGIQSFLLFCSIRCMNIPTIHFSSFLLMVSFWLLWIMLLWTSLLYTHECVSIMFIQRTEIIWHLIYLCPILGDTPNCCLEWLYQFTFLPAVCVFLYLCQLFVLAVLLILAILAKVQWNHICFSLMDSNIYRPFEYLLLYIFVPVFCAFFYWIVCSISYWFLEVL